MAGDIAGDSGPRDGRVMKRCRNCAAMLEDVGPTRCCACAKRRALAQRLRIASDRDRVNQKRREANAGRAEATNALRRARYVSRARTKECLDCGASIPRLGRARCDTCWPIHEKSAGAARCAKWVRENPRLNRLRRARRRARLLAAGGSFSTIEWLALCARYDFRCLACSAREPQIRLEPDHVLPLASGGPNTIDNIQPLCRSCNSRKRAKHRDYRP
jgi:hypothetical protein